MAITILSLLTVFLENSDFIKNFANQAVPNNR